MQQAALTYGGRYITDPEQVLDILKATSDKIADPDVAGDGRIPISNGEYTGGAEQALDGTGDTFDRVNVLRAVEAVQQLFTGTVSNADTDDTTATATAVPTINGNAVENESGSIGTDGLNDVGADDVDLYAVTNDHRRHAHGRPVGPERRNGLHRRRPHLRRRRRRDRRRRRHDRLGLPDRHRRHDGRPAGRRHLLRRRQPAPATPPTRSPAAAATGPARPAAPAITRWP